MTPKPLVLVSLLTAAAVAGCGSSNKPSASAPASAAASAGSAATSAAPSAAASAAPASSGGSSSAQPVLTAAQTCARVTPAFLHQALGGTWGAGVPDAGSVSCDYRAQATAGSVHIEVDQEALKLPPAQASQFAAQFMHTDEQGKGWVQVPGLGDEAAWNPETGSIIERIGGSTYTAQVLKDGSSNAHAIADNKRILALLTAP